MKILVGIGHPAHIHFYKNFIWDMENNGHEIKIISRNNEMCIRLLDEYNFKYHKKLVFPKTEKFIDPFSYINYPLFEYETYKIAKDYMPNVWTGIGGTTMSHVSTLLDINSIVFTDTDDAKFANNITFPFADRIYTPECYKDDIGPKQVRYPGFHELAYLHPNRFEPDPSVLDLIDADMDDKIVIMRLSSWDAAHDVGQGGFVDVVDMVKKIESTGARVVITSEGDYPKEIEHCISTVPMHKMHDLMYYASLYIGEGVTMASESAVLGTPAIFVSTRRLGYLDELEKRYGLVFNFSGKDRQRNAFLKSISILNNYDRMKWINLRKRMLSDKIDVTDYMIEVFERLKKNDK